jgi:hypothetical protein
MTNKVKFDFRKVSRGFLIACVAVCGNAFAGTLVTYDLTGGGTEVDSGIGNHYVFNTPVFAVDPLEVWAYSDEGIGNASLEPAQVISDASLGFGVCNSQEDRVRGNGTVVPCEDRQAAVTSTDNRFEQDWLLFIIPNTPDNEWVSITLESQGTQDMDISYWVGTLGQAPTSFTYAQLGASTNVNDDINAGVSLTIDLYNVQGNALLIGSSLNNLDAPDRVFVSSLTALVPIPPAFLMFGSALLALIGKRWVKA